MVADFYSPRLSAAFIDLYILRWVRACIFALEQSAVRRRLAGFTLGFVKLDETTDGLTSHAVLFAARDLQPFVCGQQLFFGFPVTFKFG